MQGLLCLVQCLGGSYGSTSVHMNMLEHWTVATIGVIDFIDGSPRSVAKIDKSSKEKAPVESH